ncbi:hypothetical protein [Aureimonas pseudogalii]|uniref:Uncharacterized protein n=1 Tax=Aureimonas pseudogalii TaxID=1744844 RepID=A0A7W6EFG5_9HYPH|nr:hypothetical protein [Aureimonas pseudogalii]MBB3997243.1 hypothetical protein [Aureimonas pseudogalii]
MSKLINKLRVLAHLLRGPFRYGIEAYYCELYARRLSDRFNRNPETIAHAKRAIRDARARLAFHAANPRLCFA